MGTLTPVLGTLTQTLGAVSTLANSVDTLTGNSSRDLRQEQHLIAQNLQQSHALEEQQAQTKAAQDRAQIEEQAKQTEEARQKALRRAIAKQNARMGASGVSTSGSGEAVLLGVYNDSQDEARNNTTLDQLRYNTIDNNLQNIQQNNILERTQLAQQRLSLAGARRNRQRYQKEKTCPIRI